MSMDRSFQWMDLIGTGAIGTVQLMIMLYDMMVKKKSATLWCLQNTSSSTMLPKENEENKDRVQMSGFRQRRQRSKKIFIINNVSQS